MSVPYTPPGVAVQEFVTPITVPQLGLPALPAFVGLAAGVITKTDLVTVTGTNAVTLPGIPTDGVMTNSSIVSVKDVDPSRAAADYDTATGYASATYTFNASAHTIARVSSPGGADAIPDGNSLYVTYTYVPSDYFQPILLETLSDVEARFGSAWNSTGTGINSPLSFAAAIAFENGARQMVLQPLFYNNAGTKQQPTNAQNAAAATWTDNFTVLRGLFDVNIVVPIVGQSQPNVGDANQLAIIEELQSHVNYMRTNENQYIVGICGEDSSSSSSVAQKATLLSHAQTLEARFGGTVNEQMVFVAPSKFTRPTPTAIGGTLSVGGQYIAAAMAGMIAARDVSQSITRRALSGFTTVGDPRTKAEKNTDAGQGLCVIEQKAGIVQVRHAITMDQTNSTAKRELSVVRAKHRVIESIQDTLENQIIGQVIADGTAPFVVRSAVIGVLEQLRTEDDIVDYGDVQARTLTLDPTAIEVRFSYRPAFPVNYITVGFTLDLTSGDITPSTTTVDTSTF